jgi:hypothetical protein
MNTLLSTLLLASLASPSAAQSVPAAQLIQVRVLDSRSGARVPNEKVSVRIKGEKAARDYTTDSDGEFSLEANLADSLYVATEWRVTCRHVHPGVLPFISVATIVQTGFMEENTCGQARSEPVKGTLTVFARKASFLENFRR